MSEDQLPTTEVLSTAPSPVLYVETDTPFEFSKGQYWIRGNDQFIAFIVDANEYAVIYQTAMAISDTGVGVFDFEAGQELSSLQQFSKFLVEREAGLLEPDALLIELALKTYQSKLGNNQIFKPKFLPRNKEEAFELTEYERYTLERRIVAPPYKYRSKKSLHWLKAGLAGDTYVCKLWDPEKDNWIMPDGKVDLTAQLGFINSYHALAAQPLSDSGEEIYDDLITRVIEMLRKKNIMFDENNFRKYFEKFNPTSVLPASDDETVRGDLETGYFLSKTKVKPPEGWSVTFPIYELSYAIVRKSDKDVLDIHFTVDQNLKYVVTFPEVINQEFIPNKTPTIEAIGPGKS